MRYFVTGGAGFIGSNYVEHLFENVQGLTGVTIFDKFTYAANPKNYEKYLSDPRLHIIKGDICDFSLLAESMKNHDFVIHFAAESHVDRSIEDASVFMRTNVVGTFNVLEACRKSGIKTVIHISTDEVYGSLDSGSATEGDTLSPNSPYAASKAASDLIARSFFKTYGLDVRVTRCTNNYGPHQFPEKLIPLMLSKIKEGGRLPIYGTGLNIREWIHVSDHCEAIQLVIRNGEPGEVYNIGSGLEISNLEIVKMLLQFSGQMENIIDFVPDRLGHDFRYSVDRSKIIKLGFKPNIPFETGLKETAKYYLD